MAEVRLLQPRPRACLFRIKRIFVPSSLSPGAGKVCASCSRIRATFTPTPRDRATLIPSYVRFAMRVRDGVVPSHAPVHVYVVPHRTDWLDRFEFLWIANSKEEAQL